MSAPRLLRERPLPTVEDTQREADLRQARRTLLRSPWLTREANPEDLRLVRRRRDELVAWFSEALGYQLQVETDTVRLRKAPLEGDGRRPLMRASSQRAFTPQGYAVLVCVLAAISQGRNQVLLDDLAREVRSSAAEAGIALDLEKVGDRRHLQAALRLLLDMGVVVERDGTVEGWDVDERVQALLDVRRDRLSLLLDVRIGQAGGAADLLRREAVPSAAGGARLRARRMLVESPVLDVGALSEDQVQWWRRNRGRAAEQLQDWLGLSVELRAEGAVAVDPADELSDRAFPGRGTIAHAALLAIGRLVERRRAAAQALPVAERARQTVTRAELRATVDDIVAEHGRAFAKGYRDDVGALTGEVVGLLADFGLLRTTSADDTVELNAAAARYSPRAVEREAPTLFAQVDDRLDPVPGGLS
ncbi:MAG: TIGR02678 family protein [Bacteroidota bacterium]|nr:TIGR02678 family protein [Bacteroidota bacterium]